MRPLPTPQQMRAADSNAIDAGTPGSVLMDRAGRAVARTAIRLMGGRYGRRAAIVCGKGSNGGDGFVAARALLLEGVNVRCLLVDDPSDVRGDAADHMDRFLRAGGRVDVFSAASCDGADVIVDALFGTGFRGAAEGAAARAIEAMNSSPALTIAVDIPSGVDAATGAAPGPAVVADTTVAMAAQKIGSAVGPGAGLAGDVTIADIGIPIEDADAWIATESDVSRAVPRRASDAHKRSVGSVAVLAGSEGMSGAAMLTARAAIRMGAGYATVGLSRSIERVVSAVLPEVLTKILTEEPQLGPDALAAFKDVLDRADSVAVGPGLGDGPGTRALVTQLLQDVATPCVLDADALNVLASDASALIERDAPTIVTPHPAELARLLRTDTSSIQSDRVEAAREAAELFGCIVVLKGARSLIARPDGRLIVNTSGSAHLATAGTGDVLTGAIAALVAAGMDPFEAAWAGVHLHGIAGEIAAAKHGGHGVIAWDVAEALPEAVAVVEVVGWD